MANKQLPAAFEAAKKQDIAAMLKRLSYKEREIIKLRFGLSPYGTSYTLSEVGYVFKMTIGRVRSIEQNALEKLNTIVAEFQPATCKTCRFWDWDWYSKTVGHGDEENPDEGLCRRCPPVFVAAAFKNRSTDTGLRDWAFPVVARYDWCGEHQPAD